MRPKGCGFDLLVPVSAATNAARRWVALDENISIFAVLDNIKYY